MKLTVLGSGTCGSQLPNIPNRQPPAFVLETSSQIIMFECSEGVKYRLEAAGYKYYDIDHIAISHVHPDHYALVHYLQSVGCFNSWVGSANKRIDIYAPRQITASFETLWTTYVPDDPERKNRIWPKLKFHTVTNPDKVVQIIGDHRLTAHAVYHGHGKVDACAFRLEAEGKIFVYSGDTGECEGIRQAAQDADFFLCEASARIADTDSPTKYGHLTPRKAGEIARDANVKHMVFFHYTGFNSDQEMVEDCKKSGYQGILSISKDMQVYEF